MKPLVVLAVALLVAGAGPGRAAAREDAAAVDLADLLGGGRLKGAALEAAIRTASGHPLGSRENPVRVNRPEGQWAYLGRLRCTDGAPPAYERVGNFGPGVFGSIIDGYQVVCGGEAGPREALIYMDMYHPDYVETSAPPGFTLKARARRP